jgi:hypothetical protein
MPKQYKLLKEGVKKMEQSEIENLRLENERLKQQIKQENKLKNEEFASELVKRGTLTPANKEQAVELLNYADDYDNGEVLNFNEGETLLTKLKNFLNNQKTLIHLNRELSADDGFESESGIQQYAENTPKQTVELDKKIRAYMQQHGVDYQTAFNAVHQ